MSRMTDAAPAGRFPRLEWVEELFAPALRKAVNALPATEGRVAGYHRGWNEADGTPSGTGRAGGKLVRPALTLLSAVAVGGRPEEAVPGAVAVELVHDFTLLHDDVMDGDALRRHRPAAWSAFGTGTAVLTGDALLAAALHTLAGTPGERTAVEKAAALRELVSALPELVRGQSDDMAFEKVPAISVAGYLAMAEGKTGALIGCACALGGILAGADAERVGLLREFGRRLGVAYQCVDDVLGIWGSSPRSGKPVGADLAARKKTLPVVTVLAGDGEDADRLRVLYRRPGPLSQEEVATATRLVTRAGGRRAAEEEAGRQLARALRALDDMRPAEAAARQLGTIARAITGRAH